MEKIPGMNITEKELWELNLEFGKTTEDQAESEDLAEKQLEELMK